MPPRILIDAFTSEFARARRMADRAAAQLSWPQLREPLDPETNSIAVIMKHLAGNLRSRWTDPLTTDGEKPWRDRDSEFIDDFPDRAALDRCWSEGWAVLDAALADFTDADLPRTVLVRNEPHSLALALSRSACHAAYHAGQIVQCARVLSSRAGAAWNTLTIPRGGSAEFNAKMGMTSSLSLVALDKGEGRGEGSAPPASPTSSASLSSSSSSSSSPSIPLPILSSQFDAALAMLHECIASCPPDHWNDKIANFTFWQVAYHVLCFIDCYLAHGDDAWQPHPVFHPLGRAELDNEFPSREFSRDELTAYSTLLRSHMHRTLAAESAATLAGPSGFPWLPFSRAELHLYNLRHVMHHTGQLSAALRRVGVDTKWAKRGSPAPA